MRRTPIALSLMVVVLVPSVALAVAFRNGVKFNSSLAVSGSVSKGSGSFVIDHPLDPAGKLLAHSFLESPDAKNIYDGVAKLNRDGEATIELPDYFLALNADFRYQFAPVGDPMPGLYLAEEVAANRFRIAGGKPGGKISWQVTGVRHDAFIAANPTQVEVYKGPKEVVDRGECIYEPLCE